MPLDLKPLQFFPTTLLATRITDINNQSIVKILYALRDAGHLYGGPGLGGLQSQGNLMKIQNRSIQKMGRAFQEMVEAVAKPNNHMLQMMAWGVIGRPGDATLDTAHNHLPYHFSAVYYPQVPAMTQPEGNIVFFDPRDGFLGGKPVSIPPQEGLMILFPSWLKHTVVPIRSAAADRICISLNAIIGPPPHSSDHFPPHRAKKRPRDVVVEQELDPESPEYFPYPED